MGIINDLIQKAKGLLDAAPPPVEKQAVKTTTFDRWDMADVNKARDMLGGIRRDLIEKVDGGAELLQDVQAAFFKVEPHLHDPQEMRASHRGNREIIEQLLQMPEVQELRELSSGDAVNSAIATASMHKPVLETAQRVALAIAEHQTEAEQREKEMEAAAEALERLMETASNAQSPAEQQMAMHGLQAAMDQFARIQKEMGENQLATEQAAQQAIKQGAQEMRREAQQAAGEMEAQEALANAYGTDPGQLQKMSAQERIDLAKKLKNNRLAEFMKLIGQFKAVQKAESRKRVTNAATEIHGVRLSDELERLTVGEYLNFACEELETLFWLRYTEKMLVTYDVHGKEKMGQGPVVVVCDESGSMGCADVMGGTREAWSKALALAMLDQARGRKRDFVYIGFASPGQQHMVEFPYGEQTLDKVLQMTEHFFGGGTYYEKPLMDALDYIEKHYESDTRNQGKPDIIFLSDDEYTSEFPEEFMSRYEKLKDKIGIRAYGIALGCSAGGAMKAICDDVSEITQVVSDPKNVGHLFRMV